ncbi:flagellin [Archaeoglobus veneficus]|uniref:Flagellin n=1 Tax=Archaeoglobus veneficus (strain DSM 11195 / SNP6) TaxID=693661 RepID=F2KP72_ARCVS|nr:flagellin [Archaeoglobus veneficus]AEA47476.1 flagellin [Archaeoglobus veneficus SNP6]
MASESASHIVLFIAALVVSSAVAAVMVSTVGELSGVLSQKNRILVESIKDDITIINDPKNVTTNPLIIYVKNTGLSTIPLDKKIVDVLVDGVYQTDYTMTSLSGNPQWEPGDVVEFRINVTLSPGSHVVRIYVRGTAWDELWFRV